MKRFSTIFLLSLSLVNAQNLLVTGRITGNNGLPLHIAYLTDDPRANSHLANRIMADSEGHFRHVISNSEPKNIFAYGVGCYALTVPLLTGLDDSVEIDLHLQPVMLSTDLSRIEVGWVSDFTGTIVRERMQLQRGGVFSATVTTPDTQVHFQIFNVSPNNWPVVHGTNARSFSIHSNGDFFGVVSARNGIATITFDPNKVPSGPEGTFEFEHPGSITAKFSHLVLDLYRKRIKFIDTLQRLQKLGLTTSRLCSAWTDSSVALKNAMLSEKSSLIRSQLLLGYFGLASLPGMILDTLFVRGCLKSIPYSSPVWFFNNDAAFDLRLIHPAGVSFLDSIIESHPSRALRATLLLELAREAQSRRDESAVRHNYSKLKDEYADTFPAALADRFIIVDTKVKTGARVPDFTFRDLDDPIKVYSRSSLGGKVYLLDFWATWCLPCIGEIPYLEDAYKKFAKRGLHILSISSDSSAADIQKFRSSRFKMPWSHVWLTRDQQKHVHDQFEVNAIPKPILVDANGIIIGMMLDVRGNKLASILDQMFAD